MESIKIVCLANSRKMKERCVAGKIVESNKWIRPVGSTETEEISKVDCRYQNGQMPKLFDIINIPLKKYKPTLFQTENYLINNKYYWYKVGVYNGSLDKLCDTPTDLWGTQSSSSHGLNDRISEDLCESYKQSLYFIRPQALTIIVQVENKGYENEKRKVRAKFNYNGVEYLFSVTDPEIEQIYLAGEDGNFAVSTENTYLCVSIGLPFNGFCYKFVASIIQRESV